MCAPENSSNSGPGEAAQQEAAKTQLEAAGVLLCFSMFFPKQFTCGSRYFLSLSVFSLCLGHCVRLVGLVLSYLRPQLVCFCCLGSNKNLRGR